MATSELEILITATNQAKAVLDDVIKGLSLVSEELTKATSAQDPEALKKALAGIVKPAGQAADAIEGVGKASKKTEEEVSTLSAGLAGLAKGLAAGAAAFFSFRAAIQFVQRGIREAAQTQQLNTALQVLGESAGKTQVQIQGAVQAIEDFGVSGSQARDTARRLLQANLDVANGARLAEAAQRLALASGEATDDVLQRITVAVQTGNTVLLRRAGINVDVEAAETRLAASLNTTRENLTQQQKQQALANAITAEAAKLQGIAAEAVGNFSSRLADLPRLTAALAESLGETLLAGINELLGAFRTFIENLRQSFAQINIGTNFTENFTAAMKTLGNILIGVGQALGVLVPIVAQVASTFFSLVNTVGGLVAAGLVLIRFIPVWGQVFSLLLIVIKLLNNAGIDFTDIIEGINVILRAFGAAVELIFLGVAEVVERVALTIQEVWARVMRFIGRTTKAEFDKTLDEINRRRAELTDRRDTFVLGIQIFTPEAEKQIARARTQIQQINSQILEAEREVIAARQAGDQSALESAAARKIALETEKKAIEENIRTLENQGKVETTLDAARNARAEAGAIAKAEKERIEAIETAFRNLLQGQGLVADGFNGMSAAGTKAVGELRTALSSIGATLSDGTQVSLEKTRAAVLAAFGQLKTVQDFQAAIDALNTAIATGVTGMETLRSEAAFRQQQVALTQINAELTFFTNALERIRATQQLYNDLILDGVQANIALQQVQANISNDRRLQAALELQSIAVTLSAARNRYVEEQQLIQQTAVQQTAVAVGSITDLKAQAVVVTAIDNQKTQQLIKNTKAYYDGLRKAQQDFLQQFNAATQRVKDIDQEIATSRTSTTNTIRDLGRNILTDEQKQADRRKEIVEQQQAFRVAANKEDTVAAQAAIARQKELASAIATGAGDPKKNAEEAQRILGQTQAQSEELLFTERVLQTEIANNAKANFQAVGVELAALVTQIQTLVAQEVLSLSVQVDKTSLTAATQEVTAAFSALVIPVKIVPTLDTTLLPGQGEVQPPLPTFARGGRVPGSSPNSKSDNILGWLTAGEWVHPVQAVRYWGEDFMRAIDGLRMPRLADGGPVGRYAEGGLVGGVSPGQGRLARAINELTTATSGLKGSKAAFQNEARTPIQLNLGSLGTFGVQGSDQTIEALKRAISQAAIKRRRS
jgi:hypothetical protein